MKQARLVFTTLAVLMAWSVATAVACDQDKQTKTSAAAVSSDKCPYATAAQCKAAKAAAAANTAKACPYSASCPHTSAAACKAAMSTAVVAVAGECNHSTSATAVTASTSGGTCSAAKSAAVTASTSSSSCCASKGAAAAVTASTAGGTCSAAKSAAAGTCNHGAKGASAEMVDGAGLTCNGHGMTTAAARSMHGDCDACVDMADCEREIESAGASTQVVPLKNGVMYVYTADSPASVHAVQAALARRNDRMAQIASTGSKTHLCGSCKEMRGAAASGKLNREVVNIEGGCLTLVTSNDPTIVAKIHAMAGITTAAKVKS